MSAKIFWLIAVLLAIGAMGLLRHHSGAHPQGTDPHAAEEIEKAQRR